MRLRQTSGIPEGGLYRLTIILSRPATIRVGRLGRFHFPAGVYVYCGSGQRNLRARVERHLRQGKALRWHIDYLLASPAARVAGVACFRGPKEGECVLARRAMAKGAQAVVKGFGASDCMGPKACPAHLLWLPGRGIGS